MIRTICLVLFFAVLGTVSAKAAESTKPAHHDLAVQLNPETGALTVIDEITVEDRESLVFRFADWMTLDGIELDGKSLDRVVRADGIAVPLPNRQRQTVTIRLSGTVPGLTEAGRDLPPAFAGGQGAFLSGYAGWFPYVGDKVISYRLEVSVPAPFHAVSSGVLTGETATQAGNMAVFKQSLSLEPPSLFVGPYQINERLVNGIRLRTYFPDHLSDYSDQYLETAGRYLETYSDQIGPYPYGDFHIISSPLPVGLGYPNLTYIGEMIVPLPFMQGQSLAHEILHNWWGNGVQVDYGSGNWAEGLTTYLADYGLARDKGRDAARQMRLGWLRDYAALPAERDQAVIRFISKRHQAAQVIGYNKTAHIFHMLEGEIGSDAFSQGIRRFWSDYQFKIIGWRDLQDAFEAASGQDLAWFFAQWIEQPGAPVLSIADVSLTRQDDAYITSLTVTQSEPAYRLRLLVDIETEAGIVRQQAGIEGPATSLRFETKTRPARVTVDPDFDLFRHLLPGESPPILRDILLSGSVNVLILNDILPPDAVRQALPRIVDRGTKVSLVEETRPGDGPKIVFGSWQALERYSQTRGLERAPSPVPNSGAAAWADRTGQGDAVLLISLDGPQGLQTIARALRHYGRQSYVMFEAGRAVDRGLWPSEDSPLSVLLSPGDTR